MELDEKDDSAKVMKNVNEDKATLNEKQCSRIVSVNKVAENKKADTATKVHVGDKDVKMAAL